MGIKVKMVDGEGPATRYYTQEISEITALGREIKISPKACATINIPGFKTEHFTETVTVLIAIGKDHTADLIMSKDSWEALLNKEPVSVTTVKEFRTRYMGETSVKRITNKSK